MVSVVGREWDKLTETSFKLLNELANELVETSFTESGLYWGVFLKCPEIQKLTVQKMTVKRIQLLDKIQGHLTTFTDLHQSVVTLFYQIQDAVDKDGDHRALVDTETILGEWIEMYRQDLLCKVDIIRDFRKLSESSHMFHSGTRDDLLIYLSVWTLKPRLNADRLAEIEAIIPRF